MKNNRAHSLLSLPEGVFSFQFSVFSFRRAEPRKRPGKAGFPSVNASESIPLKTENRKLKTFCLFRSRGGAQ